jgi:membrane dipeptidase
VAALAGVTLGRMTREQFLGASRELLSRTPLVDGHNDLAWAMRCLAESGAPTVDVTRRQTATRTDLPRLREGCVGAQFWSVYVPSTLAGDSAVTATLEQIDLVHTMIAEHADHLGLAVTADQVDAVFARGAIASLLGAEGGHSIGGSMGALRMMYTLGVRYLTLTHNDNVAWADSATDQPRLGGLSPFGREVVREMNRLGMLVDLSHVSAATMLDALAVSEAPVIFSHSSSRELVDHPRNVPDLVLGRLAGNGGVCMVTFVPDFVSSECNAWAATEAAAMARNGLDPRHPSDERERFASEYRATHPRPAATMAQVADHVEHVRDVTGVEHVGIGGDFDGCDDLPEGLEDVAQYPTLFAELLDRGWSEPECRQLAGGNLLRVMRDAEAVAGHAQAARGPSRATIATLDQADRPS